MMIWKMTFLFQGARILRFQPLIFPGVNQKKALQNLQKGAGSVSRWTRALMMCHSLGGWKPGIIVGGGEHPTWMFQEVRING